MISVSEPPTSRSDAMTASARLSLVFLLVMLMTTTVHHGFRFGIGWGWKGLLLLGAAVLLHRGALRTRGRGTPIAYSLFVAMTIIAFGILDGFLDHVLKIAGFRNVTILEGSDAVHVTTVYRLWSQDSTWWFYEGTGALAFLLALPLAWFTAHFLMARLGQDA